MTETLLYYKCKTMESKCQDYLNIKAKRGETTVQNKEIICDYDNMTFFFPCQN